MDLEKFASDLSTLKTDIKAQERLLHAFLAHTATTTARLQTLLLVQAEILTKMGKSQEEVTAFIQGTFGEQLQSAQEELKGVLSIVSKPPEPVVQKDPSLN